MPELYKFLRAEMRSDRGEHTWELGKWYTVAGPVSICENGFHASVEPLDALGSVQGEILARVEVRGEHQRRPDKECWQSMRVVESRRWSQADSVALAIYAAAMVVPIYEKKYPKDGRPRQAIEMTKAYSKPGDATAAAADAADAAAAAATDADSAAADAAAAAAYAAAAAAAAATAAAYAATAVAAAAADAAAYAATAAAAAADAAADDAAADAAAAAAAVAVADAAAAADAALRTRINDWLKRRFAALEVA